MSFVNSIKLWILLSVFATVAGWTLSFFGVLNAIGYVVMGVIGLIVYFQIRGRGFVTFERYDWIWKKIRKRFCRPIPLMFLFATVLVFIGGVIYPPTNHTGLSYRVPRVLHWLDANQWHWIYAPNFRMNTRACGIEWMSAPLLAILKSDRLLFLLNFIPFVFMPGLTFSLLKRLGVRGRVAWSWMWMLPAGYVYLLQAGSLGNDAFPVIYGMAAIDFACRAWKSQRAEDVWISMLALALLTGAKASNMPLGLMWLVLAFGLWPILKRNPIGTSAVVVLVVLVSFIPTALLNLANCGSWSGLTMERAGMDMKNPLVGLWGNPPLILMSNLCPPFFPMSGWWNQNILNFLPGFIRAPLDKNFESGYQVVWEIHFEDWAGIGPGLTVLMLIAAAFALPNFLGRRAAVCNRTIIPPRVIKWALIAPWIALAAYCAKSGMVTPARLIAPYYPLLLASFLLGAEQSSLVRKRWWRALEKLVMFVAIVMLVITPPRPLWPAKTILTRLVESNPDSKMLKRALATYTVYSIRNDPLAELRQFIPKDLKSVGFVGMPDDLDISFWKPYGTRRVDHINLGETPEQIRERKITLAIVDHLQFDYAPFTFEDWMKTVRAKSVTNITTTIAVNAGPQKWSVIEFEK
jgi:hypothetical protein